jgi:hypothetical protein
MTCGLARDTQPSAPVTRSFARREAALAGLVAGDEGFEHLIEESRRQKSVIVAVAVRELAQIIARPQEFIAFGDDDP